MKKLIAVLFLVFYALPAWAWVVDYTHLFEIDLDEELPPLEELEKKYGGQESLYDKRYDYHWNIGTVFDHIFRNTIISYGSSNVRIPHENEKSLERVLALIPKEHYQYVGPYLHTVPGIPEKILNMPGIKETKNKFPTRIAKELEDMEELEFLSPHLYYLLMPEIWPSYRNADETPRARYKRATGRVEYSPEFFAAVKKLVPKGDYLPGATPQTPLKSKLRTIDPEKDSPLTAMDVRAFASTISDVNEFGATDYNILKIAEAGFLLEAWENDNGRGLPVVTLKSTVNPCQRLVQKVKLAGLENEFFKVVAKQGFTPKTWAYTCDKSIKAYRLVNINAQMINPIVEYQNKIFNVEFPDSVTYEERQQQYAVMQSVGEMFRSNMTDVMEVRRERELLNSEFMKAKETLIDSPIVMY